MLDTTIPTLADSSRKTHTRLLDRLYGLPRPFDTLEAFQRSIHADLPGMPPEELHRELHRVDMRLALDDRPPPWLTERHCKVTAALRGRVS